MVNIFDQNGNIIGTQNSSPASAVSTNPFWDVDLSIPDAPWASTPAQPTFLTSQEWGALLPARTSLADAFARASQLWLKPVANQIATIWNDLANRDQFTNNVLDIYDNFGNFMANQTNDRNSVYEWLKNDQLWLLGEQYNIYDQTYWPNGTLTKKVNDFYGNLWDYLVRKQANQRLISTGLANKYWLSENARTISANETSLQWQAEIIQWFQWQVKALDELSQIYNKYIDGTLGKFKNIQDDYIKWLVDDNFGVQTQLAQWLLNLLSNNENVKQQISLQEAAQIRAENRSAARGAYSSGSSSTNSDTTTTTNNNTLSFDAALKLAQSAYPDADTAAQRQFATTYYIEANWQADALESWYIVATDEGKYTFAPEPAASAWTGSAN